MITEQEKQYNHEAYYWLKEHKCCVSCKKQDALTDASKAFGFDYGDMNELPTLTEPKKKLDKQTADMIRKAMTRDAG